MRRNEIFFLVTLIDFRCDWYHMGLFNIMAEIYEKIPTSDVAIFEYYPAHDDFGNPLLAGINYHPDKPWNANVLNNPFRDVLDACK